VTPQENLFNCFGCGRGGDIFELDQLYFSLGFTASVKKHESIIPDQKKAVKQKISKQKGMAIKEQKLLGRVVSYYQHTFAEDPTGSDYLKNRGITNNPSLKDFGTGFANATLLNILPEDDQIIRKVPPLSITGQAISCVNSSRSLPLNSL